VLLTAPPPLADRQRAGGKKPRGGFDAALADRFHQAQAMVVGVLHFTHEIEITGESSHGATILVATRRLALPQPGGHLHAPLRTHILQLRQGVMMYPSNSTAPVGLDKSRDEALNIAGDEMGHA
jgi:hypothetical protein